MPLPNTILVRQEVAFVGILHLILRKEVTLL